MDLGAVARRLALHVRLPEAQMGLAGAVLIGVSTILKVKQRQHSTSNLQQQVQSLQQEKEQLLEEIALVLRDNTCLQERLAEVLSRLEEVAGFVAGFEDEEPRFKAPDWHTMPGTGVRGMSTQLDMTKLTKGRAPTQACQQVVDNLSAESSTIAAVHDTPNFKACWEDDDSEAGSAVSTRSWMTANFGIKHPGIPALDQEHIRDL